MGQWKNRIGLKWIVLGGCILVVAYLALIPLGMLLYNSFRSAPPGEPGAHFTLKNYAEAYLDPELYPLWKNTLVFCVGTCALAFFLGTALAWIYERTNTPLKKVFAVVALVPFIIPGVLGGISWILLLSPKIGLVNLLLMKSLGISKPPFNIYTLAGMIWTDGIHSYPLIFLMMSAAFRSMDMALEESAYMSGSGTLSTFWHITLPMMRPAFISAMLLTFTRVIESFAVPALIGLPAGIEVFSSKIYLALKRFPSNLGLAGALAVTILLLSAMGLYFYHRVTSTEKRFATITGKGFRPRQIDLGRWRYVVTAICSLFFLFTVGLPLFVVLWSSFTPFYAIPSAAALSRLTFKNYVHVLTFPLMLRAFRNSTFLMLATATLTMLLTSVIAWIVVKSKLKGRQVLDALTFIPVAIPGVVMGVSLIYVYLVVPIPIYNTIWILLLAYITILMPYGMRTTSAAMIQIHSDLEEACAVSGGSWGVTFRKIVLPLLIPGFMAGWIYIAMISLRELSASILLYGPGTEVLSVIIFDLWNGGSYPTLCALGLLMVAILVLLAFVANKIGSKIGIKRMG